MKRIVAATIFSVLVVSGFAHAYDDGDFQVWNTDTQELKINDKFKTALEEEFRFGNNANEFYYHHYDIGLAYAANKHLDLGLGYRQIYERKKGKFKPENEPAIYAILKGELWGAPVSNRSRLEYRHFDYQTDSWRYRNMFTIRSPWKFTKFKIQPYLADEIFISSIGAAFNNNRFYAGLSFTLTKHISADLYYMMQNTRTVTSKSTGWPRSDVLGTKIKIMF